MASTRPPPIGSNPVFAVSFCGCSARTVLRKSAQRTPRPLGATSEPSNRRRPAASSFLKASVRTQARLYAVNSSSPAGLTTQQCTIPSPSSQPPEASKCAFGPFLRSAPPGKSEGTAPAKIRPGRGASDSFVTGRKRSFMISLLCWSCRARTCASNASRSLGVTPFRTVAAAAASVACPDAALACSPPRSGRVRPTRKPEASPSRRVAGRAKAAEARSETGGWTGANAKAPAAAAMRSAARIVACAPLGGGVCNTIQQLLGSLPFTNVCVPPTGVPRGGPARHV